MTYSLLIHHHFNLYKYCKVGNYSLSTIKLLIISVGRSLRAVAK